MAEVGRGLLVQPLLKQSHVAQGHVQEAFKGF